MLGRLAISRAFGDYDCKKIPVQPHDDPNGEPIIRNFITSEPEIHMVDINPAKDDFILLASDGLFDRFTSEQVVDELHKSLKKDELME